MQTVTPREIDLNSLLSPAVLAQADKPAAPIHESEVPIVPNTGTVEDIEPEQEEENLEYPSCLVPTGEVLAGNVAQISFEVYAIQCLNCTRLCGSVATETYDCHDLPLCPAGRVVITPVGKREKYISRINKARQNSDLKALTKLMGQLSEEPQELQTHVMKSVGLAD